MSFDKDFPHCPLIIETWSEGHWVKDYMMKECITIDKVKQAIAKVDRHILFKMDWRKELEKELGFGD